MAVRSSEFGALDDSETDEIAQRQKAFADAAKNGYLIALDHMYFPGIGRLRKEKVGYRWIPAPYINDSQKP